MDEGKENRVTNCFLAARTGEDTALFTLGKDKKMTVNLDHYALIPMEVFHAMGGPEHKAVRRFIDGEQKEMMRNYAASLPTEIAVEFTECHCAADA